MRRFILLFALLLTVGGEAQQWEYPRAPRGFGSYVLVHGDSLRVRRADDQWIKMGLLLNGNLADSLHTHSLAGGLSGALPIAQGGTGATTAGDARTNLDVQQADPDLADLSSAGSSGSGPFLRGAGGTLSGNLSVGGNFLINGSRQWSLTGSSDWIGGTLRSNSTVAALRLEGSDGMWKGYWYGDGTSQGFLNEGGSWVVQWTNGTLATGTVPEARVSGEIEAVTAGNQLSGGGTEGSITLHVVEGAGSDLDADLLDGQSSEYFLNTGTSFGGDVTGAYNATVVGDDSHAHTTSTLSGNVSAFTNDAGYITDGNAGWDNQYGFITDGNTGWDNQYGFITDGNTGWDNSYGFFNTSNDGSGSGLDADLLDGQSSEYFLNTGTSFGGDVTGAYNATVVGDDSHAHTTSTLSGNVSAFTNDAGYITDGNAGWDNQYGFFTTANDGSGSGLDADLLDGYHASNFLGFNGTSYYQASTWIQLASNIGLYAPNSGAGTHWAPNNANYGSWQIQGGKGGYYGIELYDALQMTLMFDASGNGGFYRQGGGANWPLYWNNGTGEWHVNSSSGNTIWHSGNLTSNAQLANGAGYITDGNTGWDNSYGFITDGNTGWDNSYGFFNTSNDGSGSGLDADLLDGYHLSSGTTANTVVFRDGNGRIQATDPSAASDVATKNYVDNNSGDDGDARWTLLASAQSTVAAASFSWYTLADIDSYPGYDNYMVVGMQSWFNEATPTTSDFACAYVDTMAGNGAFFSGTCVSMANWSANALFIETLAGNYSGVIAGMGQSYAEIQVLGNGQIQWRDTVNGDDFAIFLLGGD